MEQFFGLLLIEYSTWGVTDFLCENICWWFDVQFCEESLGLLMRLVIIIRSDSYYIKAFKAVMHCLVLYTDLCNSSLLCQIFFSFSICSSLTFTLNSIYYDSWLELLPFCNSVSSISSLCVVLTIVNHIFKEACVYVFPHLLNL